MSESRDTTQFGPGEDPVTGWPAPPSYAQVPPAAAMPPAEGTNVPRRRRVIVASSAVLPLIAGIAAFVLVSGHRHSAAGNAPDHTLALPASVDGLTQQTTPTAMQLANDLRDSFSSKEPDYAPLYRQALVGIYARRSTRPENRLIVIGFFADQSPVVRRAFGDATAPEIVDSVMLGASVPDSTAYPAGPLGGALHCGTLTAGGVKVPICVWADGSTVAVVVDALAGSTRQAAVTSLDLRTAAEH